ncbi:MAG: glycosyl hydrolase family 28-related protein [Pseudomonadota bacterium]
MSNQDETDDSEARAVCSSNPGCSRRELVTALLGATAGTAVLGGLGGLEGVGSAIAATAGTTPEGAAPTDDPPMSAIPPRVALQGVPSPKRPRAGAIVPRKGGPGGADSTVSLRVVDTIAELRSARSGRTVDSPAAVLLRGHSTAGDGGGGLFIWTAGVASADNDGTIVVPSEQARSGCWRRVEAGGSDGAGGYALRPEWFGAKGDGSTVDSQAIAKTLEALPEQGGILLLAAGRQYLVDKTLELRKATVIKGAGYSEQWNVAGASVILKKHTVNGPAVLVANNACVLENLVVRGETGNGGDGIVVLGGRTVLRHVSVFDQGRDGVRIGGGGEYPVHNTNAWVMEKVISKHNGRHGVIVTDENPQSTDANAGYAIGVDVAVNGGDGLRLGKCWMNAFVGLLADHNVGCGARVTGAALAISFFGCDLDESNNYSARTPRDLCIEKGAKDTVLIASRVRPAKMTDEGTSTAILGSLPGFTQLPAGTGPVINNGVGPSYAGQSAYLALSGDGVERIRVGWSDTGVARGLVAAQILAGVSTLSIASRDNPDGSIEFRAGPGLPLLMRLRPDGLVLDYLSESSRARVEAGEKDSGGKGYRILRIPND